MPRLNWRPSAWDGRVTRVTAPCEERTPAEIATEVGGAGAAALKRRATGAVSTYLRPIRKRRAEFAADRGELRRVLRAGDERATEIATRTLSAVRSAIGMSY